MLNLEKSAIIYCYIFNEWYMVKSMKKVTNSFWYFFILFFSSLILSCDISFNQSQREFFEYWTESVLVGRYDTVTFSTVINGVTNTSAKDNVKFNVLLSNPQNYDLDLLDESGQPNFSVLDSEGNDVASSKSISLSSPERNVITIEMSLADATEKEELVLEGSFYIVKEDEKFLEKYSYSFRQNTPPDNPGNLRNPVTAEIDGYHCLHFNYPDQSLKRNSDLVFTVSCYLLENGTYTYIASKTLTSDDSMSASDFTYYFEEQEKSLQYDYVVTITSPDGLTSETVSTAPNLGISYVTEPEIDFSDNGTFTGVIAEQDGLDYMVIEYTGESLLTSVTNTSDGAEMTVKINEEICSENSVLSDGFNTIEVTVSKNLCRPVTVSKNVYVVKELQAPELRFYKHSGNDYLAVSDTAAEDSTYNSYECYNLPLTVSGTGNVNFELTAGSEETIVVGIDNNKTQADEKGKFYLELGPHEIELKVSRQYCQTKTFKRYVYVQGLLADPTINYTGSQDGTDDAGNPLYKFSYLTYDEMPVTITAGNKNNTLSILVGDVEQDSSFSLAPDATYTISITQSRQYCKTTEPYKKTIAVRIKPVTAKLQNQVHHWHTDGGESVDLTVSFYLESTRTSAFQIWSCNNWDVDGHDYWVDVNNGDGVLLEHTSDIFYFYTNRAIDEDDNGDDFLGIVDKGNSNTTHSLETLKKNQSFDTGNLYGDDGHSRFWITVILSE